MTIQLIPIFRYCLVTGNANETDTAISHVLRTRRQQYLRKGYEPPWIGYFAKENNKIVGTCGFNGSPTNGKVEIDYLTFPGFENAGVATRMASALIEITESGHRPHVQVIARTPAKENASVSILRKLQFTMTREFNHPTLGKTWEWQRNSNQQVAENSFSPEFSLISEGLA
jgi:RimJ/RimL family protein N-acetyltransferase